MFYMTQWKYRVEENDAVEKEKDVVKNKAVVKNRIIEKTVVVEKNESVVKDDEIESIKSYCEETKYWVENQAFKSMWIPDLYNNFL